MNESSLSALRARSNMDTQGLLEMVSEQPSKLLALFGLDDEPTLSFRRFQAVTGVPHSTCYQKWDSTKSSFDPDFPVGSKKTDSRNSPLSFVSIEAIAWILKRREARRVERLGDKVTGGMNNV